MLSFTAVFNRSGQTRSSLKGTNNPAALEGLKGPIVCAHIRVNIELHDSNICIQESKNRN